MCVHPGWAQHPLFTGMGEERRCHALRTALQRQFLAEHGQTRTTQ